MKKILYIFAAVLAFVLIASCKEDTRPGEVHGTVSYRETDITDVVVTFTGENGTYTYTTNEKGYYVFRDLPAGDYVVSVSYNGKEVASYLEHYEKADNPSLVSVEVNGFHVRNIIIPDSEDMGWDEQEETDEDQYTLPDAEIPILAWHSIPAAYTSLERYQELKDCGFTISYSFLANQEEILAALDVAEQAGIKLLIPYDDTKAESIVNAVKDKSALYGYYLHDEPTTKQLDSLANCAQHIIDIDNKHAIYVNLFPNYVSEDDLGSTYEEYVKKAVKTLKTTQVSFDFYPIRETGVVDTWWQNLEIIRDESEAANMPFWAFALSTSHNPYPIPTLAHLRMQMYTNLAYGAQCLQYFTYWCPTPGKWNFNNAPIEENGIRTDVYDVVKTMNEELQARAGVFMGAKVLGVYHTGEIPVGTHALTGYNRPIKALHLEDNGIVVSFLENGKWSYVMFVNRSHEVGFDFSVDFDRDMQVVYSDGTIEDAGNSYQDKLEAGDCAIFRCRK